MSIQFEQMLDIRAIIDDAKCFDNIRKIRWPYGVVCPYCDASSIIKNGKDEIQTNLQKYKCKHCNRYFDDLTGTIFAGHHQSVVVWMLCLYFMGLNLSNRQIAHELDLNISDVQQMTSLLRKGIVERKPEIRLDGEVECDEVYVVAGHKGHPEAVKKKAEKDAVTG